MISIRKAANELDHMEELLAVVTRVYSHASHSSAQYAIEIDPTEAAELRSHLRALEEQVKAAALAEEWPGIQASFRGELRDYHDKAVGRLQRLREEIKSASEAVQLFSESVASSDADHEVQI